MKIIYESIKLVENSKIMNKEAPDNYLSSEYKEISKLGSGTYGCVYKGISKKNNKVYAIKKIKLEVETEGVPSTALREIVILKRMSHPNIIK